MRRKLLWGKLKCMFRLFRDNVRVVVLSDLNARVGDELVMAVVGKYVVPIRNDSGEQLIGLCVEREFL